MKNAIIIHGTYGNANENWIPWLKNELEKTDYNVYSPNFPTPQDQNLESWLNVFKDFYRHINPQTIFIGHSLGVAFILSILEKLNFPIRAIFLVSGFLGSINNKEFDNLNYTFVNENFDWEKIKSKARKIFIYHSDNDPYVPIEKAYELSKNLKTEPEIINNAGHFNKESGYVHFDILLKDIKELDN